MPTYPPLSSHYDPLINSPGVGTYGKHALPDDTQELVDYWEAQDRATGLGEVYVATQRKKMVELYADRRG
jgi:hypothetical protein